MNKRLNQHLGEQRWPCCLNLAGLVGLAGLEGAASTLPLGQLGRLQPSPPLATAAL